MRPSARLIAGITSAALLSAPLLALASGCSFLGIQNPNEAAQSASGDASALPAGAVDFDDMIVSVNTDTSTWQWTTTEDASGGSVVIAIPIHLENNSDGSRVLSPLYCKIVDPSGTTQDDLTSTYADDVLNSGSLYSGSSRDGVIHVVYHGAGTYALKLDNLLGVKEELDITMPDAHDMGIRMLPTALTSASVEGAFPAGVTFTAEDLSITLSADRESYNWTQAIAPGDSMDGVWCVGVPATVTNTSGEAQSLSSEVYEKFNEMLDLQADPSAYFADDVANQGTIAAGQTVTGMVYFIYHADGTYYLAMDQDGTTVLASVVIAQYS